MCTWNNSLCCVEHFGCALHAWRDRGAGHSVAGMSVLPSPLPSTWDGGGLGGRSTIEYLIGKPTSQSTTSAASSKRCAVALEHARARMPAFATNLRVRVLVLRALMQAQVPPVCAASGRSRRRSYLFSACGPSRLVRTLTLNKRASLPLQPTYALYAYLTAVCFVRSCRPQNPRMPPASAVTAAPCNACHRADRKCIVNRECGASDDFGLGCWVLAARTHTHTACQHGSI